MEKWIKSWILVFSLMSSTSMVSGVAQQKAVLQQQEKQVTYSLIAIIRQLQLVLSTAVSTGMSAQDWSNLQTPLQDKIQNDILHTYENWPTFRSKSPRTVNIQWDTNKVGLVIKISPTYDLSSPITWGRTGYTLIELNHLNSTNQANQLSPSNSTNQANSIKKVQFISQDQSVQIDVTPDHAYVLKYSRIAGKAPFSYLRMGSQFTLELNSLGIAINNWIQLSQGGFIGGSNKIVID